MFQFFDNTLFYAEDIPYLLHDIGINFLRNMFEYFYNSGGIWIIFTLFLILYPKRICLNRKFIFCMGIILAVITTFLISLLFSTMDLSSHLRATGRILLTPSMILLFIINNKRFDT